MCSSYDYDAPISEAGWTTPKYYLLQELLGKYRSPEEKECPVPEPFPVIEIPAVELNAAAPLFEQLPDFVQSEQVKPMEDFNQGWGKHSLPYHVACYRSQYASPHYRSTRLGTDIC